MSGGSEPQSVPTNTSTGPSDLGLPFILQAVQGLSDISNAPISSQAANFDQIRKGLLSAAAPTNIFQNRDPAIDKSRDAAIAAATDKALPALASQFSRQGQRTSGLAKDAATKTISDIVGRNYAQSYDTADARQLSELEGNKSRALSAYSQLPQLAAMQFNLSEPQVKSQRLDQLIQAAQALGQKGQNTQTLYSNQGAGLFGGALGGAGLGAQLGSIFPGLGTGVGAILGGGLGILGDLF